MKWRLDVFTEDPQYISNFIGFGWVELLFDDDTRAYLPARAYSAKEAAALAKYTLEFKGAIGRVRAFNHRPIGFQGHSGRTGA